jgi:hypothetical protein
MLRFLFRNSPSPRKLPPANPHSLDKWATRDVRDALIFIADTLEARHQFAQADMVREAARRLREDGGQ